MAKVSKATISVCKGRGHISHNNRQIITQNVDQKRMENNITYADETLEEAYEKCFGEAVREFNAKQNRSDRKIENYLDKIKSSGNGEKPFYEIVVQVGDRNTFGYGTGNEKKAERILDDYMRSFQERNPNLHVFNAVMHCDEATPHLHIDYIPVAKGYKKGLQARNSLDKALKQMGIDGKANKRENSTMKWQEQERGKLVEILKEHKIELQPPNPNKPKRKHLSVDQYKAANEEIEKQVRKIPRQIESAPTFTSKERVTVWKTDLEQLEHRAKLSSIHKNNLIEMEKTAEERLESANNYMVSKINKADELEKMAQKNLKRSQEKMAEAHEKMTEANQKLAEADKILAEAEQKLEASSHITEKLEAELKETKQTLLKREVEYARLKKLFNELHERIGEKVKEQVEVEVAKFRDEFNDVKEKLQQMTEFRDNLSVSLANTVAAFVENIKASSYLYERSLLDPTDREIIKAQMTHGFDTLKEISPDLEYGELIEPELTGNIKKHMDLNVDKGDLMKKYKGFDIYKNGENFNVFKKDSYIGTADTIHGAMKMAEKNTQAFR